MNRIAALALLLPALLLGSPVPAAEVSGLYEAVVPVVGQSAGERARAVTEGFRQVLVKVSGQRSVLALPALQAEFARADSLLGSFSYEAPVARLPGQPQDPVLGALRIRLKFDPASVRAALLRARAPVWGASRPPVHLWVVRGDAGLLAMGTPQADTLIDAAGLRGLPAVLPSPGDIEGPASARVALLGTLTPAAGRVRVAGVLRIDGSNEPVEATGPDEYAALRALVDVAADQLGARYALVARTDQLKALRLRVAGVRTLEAHAALEAWLAGLPVVKDVTLEGVGGDRATFVLMLAGEPGRVVQAMTADGRFSAIGSPVEDGSSLVLEATFGATP